MALIKSDNFNPDKLARVYWHRGQTLLPDHLVAQEEALLAEMKLRFQNCGLPYYGIGKFEWNESLLEEGVLSIISLTLVLPSGELIDVPKNAMIQPYNMNILATSRLSVYLHILQEDNATLQISILSEQDNSIERMMYKLELSGEQEYSSALHTIKLVEFNKDPEGNWKMGDYIPPLLQVGTSPFIMKKIDYLSQLLEGFHFRISREITTSYLSGESLLGIKQCIQSVYKLKHFLNNLQSQIHFHPYHVYEALKFFYMDICLYHGCTPENLEAPYLHDQLEQCLEQILTPLFREMQLTKGKYPYVPFKKKEGMFVISELPLETVKAKEIYFLIQKPSATAGLSLGKLKLASMSRIVLVHQMALQGIPFNKIDRPPFQHTFGAEVEFFRITTGEEWDHALADKSIAFYTQPDFEEINAYIYWRLG